MTVLRATLRTLLVFASTGLLASGMCAAQSAPSTSSPTKPDDSAAATTYMLDPAQSRLEFTFVQAGAKNTGRFGKYDVTLTASGTDFTGARLEVSVDVGSIDTEDEERDSILRGPDLFDVAKYPKATFVAEKLTRTAKGYDANGKLTIRNVTREVRIPLVIQVSTAQGRRVAHVTGQTTIKRLDFGVGQGEWKSTEWVDDAVTVSFDLRLPER